MTGLSRHAHVRTLGLVRSIQLTQEDEDELPLREFAQPVVRWVRELLAAHVQALAALGHEQREEALRR